ncbi:MAG: alanine racemase [Thermoanaerobaculia bacterium]
MHFLEIPTPAFLVDQQRFRRNCDAMRAKAERSGVAFRPHVKTHKTIEGARLQHGGASGPITVSTLAEAEAFGATGFGDVTYAVPIDPGKLERAADLMRTIRLAVLIDHAVAAEALDEWGRAHDVRFRVFLKVDSGAKRAGVDPDSDEAVALGRRLTESPAIEFVGLLTHAGHSYAARSREEIVPIAESEAAVLTALRDRIGAEGLLRSVGATPTASVVDRIPDTDEVRPGNYVFYDAFQAAIGSCTLDDCAASVLVTVLSHYPAQNKMIVDGGALALSKDTGPTHVDSDCGYGIVCDGALRPLPLRFAALSQEHGQIVGRGAIDFAKHPIGSRLRIVPNHSCLTAALFEHYWIVEEGKIVDEWRPVRGW